MVLANRFTLLPSFGADLLPVSYFVTKGLQRGVTQSVILLMPWSNSNIWFTTLDAPDLFANFFAHSLLYCQSMSGGLDIDIDRDNSDLLLYWGAIVNFCAPKKFNLLNYICH